MTIKEGDIVYPNNKYQELFNFREKEKLKVVYIHEDTEIIWATVTSKERDKTHLTMVSDLKLIDNNIRRV